MGNGYYVTEATADEFQTFLKTSLMTANVFYENSKIHGSASPLNFDFLTNYITTANSLKEIITGILQDRQSFLLFGLTHKAGWQDLLKAEAETDYFFAFMKRQLRRMPACVRIV